MESMDLLIRLGISIRIIALSVMMIGNSIAQTPKSIPNQDSALPQPVGTVLQEPVSKDTNNGSAPASTDPSKLVKANGAQAADDPAGDGNNGHGNDPTATDSSNPGQGKDELLIITPSTATDDPFDIIAMAAPPGGSPQVKQNPTKSASPVYGSIPYINGDDTSIQFLLNLLVADAQRAALAKGTTPQITAKLETAYFRYAHDLAKTLSHLTREEQNFVFYGRK